MARHDQSNRASRRFLSLRSCGLQPSARGSMLKEYKTHCEPLEERAMLSVAPLYYSVTGTGNNTANPSWGSAGADLYRGIVAANYGNDISTLNGQSLPSARVISNVVGDQSGDILDPRDLSAFTYAWGQFIDHDLDLTPDGGASAPIAVPSGRSAIRSEFDRHANAAVHALADRPDDRHQHEQSAESGRLSSRRSSTARRSMAPTRRGPRHCARFMAASSRPAPATCCRSTRPGWTTPTTVRTPTATCSWPATCGPTRTSS